MILRTNKIYLLHSFDNKQLQEIGFIICNTKISYPCKDGKIICINHKTREITIKDNTNYRKIENVLLSENLIWICERKPFYYYKKILKDFNSLKPRTKSKIKKILKKLNHAS